MYTFSMVPTPSCSLDKGVACAQHIELPTHTCGGATCAETSNSAPLGCIRLKKTLLVYQQVPHVLKLAFQDLWDASNEKKFPVPFRTKLNYAHNYYGPYACCSLDKGVAYTREGGGGTAYSRSNTSLGTRAARRVSHGACGQCAGASALVRTVAGAQRLWYSPQ